MAVERIQGKIAMIFQDQRYKNQPSWSTTIIPSILVEITVVYLKKQTFPYVVHKIFKYTWPGHVGLPCQLMTLAPQTWRERNEGRWLTQFGTEGTDHASTWPGWNGDRTGGVREWQWRGRGLLWFREHTHFLHVSVQSPQVWVRKSWDDGVILLKSRWTGSGSQLVASHDLSWVSVCIDELTFLTGSPSTPLMAVTTNGWRQNGRIVGSLDQKNTHHNKSSDGPVSGLPLREGINKEIWPKLARVSFLSLCYITALSLPIQ